ncbi:MAG: orotidine-5'-phosphate decarboxylase [Streptomycetaceae bacterium]|nr:MAG: orotidine-5'-phosphate decarboxylase [Streptomycetaceae bacterium]
MKSTSPIILAVDTPDFETASAWIQATQGSVAAYKLGLEFFARFGYEGVARLREMTDADLFLDLKLHDIPNTVAGAVRQVVGLTPRFLTVHASGGRAMMQAAVAEAPSVEITAVTILTSLGDADLQEIGFAHGALDAAVKLASLAKESGARAIVCSPLEIAAIRQAVGPEMTIITPGVRPSDEAGGDDQTRIMSPAQAMNAGATYLVIGRPITRFWPQGAQALASRAQALADQVK